MGIKSKFFSSKETAKILNVSVMTMARWRKNGLIKPTFIIGGMCLYSKRDIRNRIKPRRAGPPVRLERLVPKNQKRKLSVCPKCKTRFYYWQYASRHANEKKHWGMYRSWPEFLKVISKKSPRKHSRDKTAQGGRAANRG